MDVEMRQLIKEAAHEAAHEAAEATVHQTLAVLGVDVENPRHMQEDFAFLRRNRRAQEQAVTWARRTIIVTLLSALLSLLVLGFKTFVRHKGVM